MKIEHYVCCIIIFFTIIMTLAVSAQDLYKITAKEMGMLSLDFDYYVPEIKRSDRIYCNVNKTANHTFHRFCVARVGALFVSMKTNDIRNAIPAMKLFD